MEKEAYIYTYVNKETKKTYIGSRSKYNEKAEDDFNIKYFSSSNDQEFRNDMANGLLEGLIILKIYTENAGKKIIEIEANMIKAYWDKFGKENSYNHFCRNTFSTAGTHRDKETNKLTGRKLTKETKLKISEKAKLRTGELNSFFGKHHTQESKDKMAKAKIGNTYCKGVPKSEEHKLHLSESLKGKFAGENNPMYGKNAYANKTKEEMKIIGKKISDANKGHLHTEETKKKISASKMGHKIIRYIFIDENNIEHIMDRSNAHRHHPNWIEIRKVE